MNLEILYEKYNILIDAKDRISEHVQDYADAIQGTQGDEKEKKLSTQILSKFFKHFPSQQTEVLTAILDLCEDEDSMIRICALKTLPILGKDAPQYLDKIVYVYAQFLQHDNQECSVAGTCLKLIYKDYAQVVIKALFIYIQNSNNVDVRQKCISFIIESLPSVPVNGNKEEIEDLIIEEFRKLLTDLYPQEFIIIIPYLTFSKYGKTLSGANHLVQTISKEINLDQDFDTVEEGETYRIETCLDYALPLFSPYCDSNKFIIYLCNHVLPKWEALKDMQNGEMRQWHILMVLAELSIHCSKLENPISQVMTIFDLLQTYLPPPPPTEDTPMPELDFSSVECLLFAFHRLARQCPEFLLHDAEELEDFRDHLNYFYRGAEHCLTELKTTLTSGVMIRKSHIPKFKVAPILLENILRLINDLVSIQPTYKVYLTLSFLNKTRAQRSTSQKSTCSQRTHAPIKFNEDNSTDDTTYYRWSPNVRARRRYEQSRSRSQQGYWKA